MRTKAGKETAERAKHEALATRAKELTRQLAEETKEQSIGSKEAPPSGDGNGENANTKGNNPADSVPTRETPPDTP